jgi:hypothetical protein
MYVRSSPVNKIQPVIHYEWVPEVALVIKGVRNIAKVMGKRPETIMRWRKQFRGSQDPRLCFPAMLVHTGHGNRWDLITTTTLIDTWIQRWSAIDCAALQSRAERRHAALRV